MLLSPSFGFTAAITTIFSAAPGTLQQARGFTAVVDSHIAEAIAAVVLDNDACTQGVNNREADYTARNGTFLVSSFVMETSMKILVSDLRGEPVSGNYPRAGFQLSATDNDNKTIQVEIAQTASAQIR